MKKLLALLLALVMVLGLAACGTSTTTPTAAPDNAPAADNADTSAPTLPRRSWSPSTLI